MNLRNNIIAEPPLPRVVADVSGVVSSPSPSYQLSGRLMNSGTYICDIRVPDIFDSENAIQRGKLFYNNGTNLWSDIYWRSATDTFGTFRYIVFTEIRKDLELRLFDLLAHATSRGQEETFFKGPAFILRPETIPYSDLAQSIAKKHARKTTPENDGSYVFNGCLERQ